MENLISQLLSQGRVFSVGLLVSALAGCASLERTAALDSGPQTVAAQWVARTGRMQADPQGGWRATWPGVHWSLRFNGTAVGVEIDDAFGHWVVEVDGVAVLHIAPDPLLARRTLWVRSLSAGEHVATLIKRSESPQHAGRMVGFHLDTAARALAPLPMPARRIEFVGDSYTAAMGNLSTVRACTEDEIWERTDITQGFAILTARALAADWQIHAKSGAGLVRNWAGKIPNENRTHYGKVLQTDSQPTAVWDWQPQVVVIGLGTNDFSTPVADGEPRDAASLEREFVAQYKGLLTRLRQAYRDPVFVLLSLPLQRGDRLRPIVSRLVAEERTAGFSKVHELDWGKLRVQGCAAHPDAQDHRYMAQRLTQTIPAAMPAWN